ncbi:MAG: phage holin family protein [Brachymonas sp.]|nr:phage holin family protein [Brachymonas sp.]
MQIVVKWSLSAVALMFLAYLLPGIAVKSFGSALLAAAIIALLNSLVRPVLIVLTLPVTVITLGLFLLVINAWMFRLAGSILSGFVVNSFWWALAGAIIYSFLSMLIDSAMQQVFR